MEYPCDRVFPLSSWIIVEPSGGFTGVAFFFGGILTKYYWGGEIPKMIYEKVLIGFTINLYDTPFMPLFSTFWITPNGFYSQKICKVQNTHLWKPWFGDYSIVWPSTWCKYKILAPLSLKIIHVVALDLLFPNLQVSSNSDMPRGIGDNFSPMCWFLDYSG